MRFVSLIIAIVASVVGCTHDTDQTTSSTSSEVQPNPASFKIPFPEESDRLAWDVIRDMWDHVNFYEDEDAYKSSIGPATKGQIAVYACTWYLSEVRNGGHYQFFYNGTGMVWEDAVMGFRLLNATEHLEVITAAIAVFPDSKPAKDRDARLVQVESIDERMLDKLDFRLYGLTEDFDVAAKEYILEHRDEFFVEP